MAIVSRYPAAAEPLPAAPRSTLHRDLVQVASKWLRGRGCKIVLNEFRCTTTEEPDAIGWRGTSGPSFLVEVKTSRADFLRDRKKPFRVNPQLGVGEFRYFLAPAGLIPVSELPEGWGLVEVDGGRATLVRGRDPKRYCLNDAAEWGHTCNHQAERQMLLSAMSRLYIGRPASEADAMLHATYPRPDVAAAREFEQQRREAVANWERELLDAAQ